MNLLKARIPWKSKNKALIAKVKNFFLHQIPPFLACFKKYKVIHRALERFVEDLL